MTTLAFALRARTFRSLRRHRNYRIFFTGQLVSLAGTWMQNVALAWLVIELSGSAIAIGALAFWRFIPFTVFGLVAGVVADRFESRKLVMATQGGAMAMSIALAIVTLTGTATLPIVYVLAALGGIALAFDAPGRQSLTFQMVGPRELPNAVALNSGLFNGSRIIGPAIAGVVIAAVGTGLCFVVNAVSFLAVLTALAIVRESELRPVEKRPVEHDRRRPATRVPSSRGTTRSCGSSCRRHARLDRRLQLPRARAAPRRRHAARRTGGLRLALRRLRGWRSRRCARRGDVPRRELASVRDRARRPSACSCSCSRRCRTPYLAGADPLRHRHLVHALHRECERPDPARRTRLPPRSADRDLPLRLPRPRAGRRALRGMARRGRRHLARVCGRRLRRRSRRSSSRTPGVLVPPSPSSHTPGRPRLSRPCSERRRTRYATTTPTSVNASIIAAVALIAGVTPKRSCPQM